MLRYSAISCLKVTLTVPYAIFLIVPLWLHSSTWPFIASVSIRRSPTRQSRRLVGFGASRLSHVTSLSIQTNSCVLGRCHITSSDIPYFKNQWYLFMYLVCESLSLATPTCGIFTVLYRTNQLELYSTIQYVHVTMQVCHFYMGDIYGDGIFTY